MLVIHPGALGDVLQAVPALRALARDAGVTFAGQPRLGRLLAETGTVEAAVTFDTLGLEALFATAPPAPRLRELLRQMDRVVSWFGARDARYQESLRAMASECTVAPPVSVEADVPVWRHLLATVTAREPTADERRPLSVPAAWRDAARRQLQALGVEPGRGVLVVHPGAGSPVKLWPAERFAEAIAHVSARREDLGVVVHEGPADHESVERLLALLPPGARRLYAPDLALLSGVLAESTLYLGADSGVSHLASAVGCRALIFHGPGTLPRWSPWARGSRGQVLTS